MNSWKAVGYIFSLLGFFLFILAMILGVAASSVFPYADNSQLNSLRGTLFLVAAAPILVFCVPMFIIGFVGLYAGRDVKITSSEISSQPNPIRGEISSPTVSPNVPNNVPASRKSIIVCGSCGTKNDLDATFCKKCGSRFE